MSEETKTTEKQEPNPQKIKWKNVAYYKTFEEAHAHRLKFNFENLNGDPIPVKVRRCGPDKSRFVVKIGTPIKGKKDE